MDTKTAEQTMNETENPQQEVLQNPQPEVLRLPLWRTCYEEMLRDGIDYGKTYDASFFEERLKDKRDSMGFSLAVSQIRTALLHHGMFLSGRGQKGEQFVVVAAAANARVMENFQAQAVLALHKGVLLGRKTRIEVLTEEEREKHASTLERVAIRSALIARKIPVLKRALAALQDKKAA